MHFYWLDQVYLYLMRDYRITVGLDDTAVRRLRGRLPHRTSRFGAWRCAYVRACMCVWHQKRSSGPITFHFTQPALFYRSGDSLGRLIHGSKYQLQVIREVRTLEARLLIARTPQRVCTHHHSAKEVLSSYIYIFLKLNLFIALICDPSPCTSLSLTVA